MNPRPFLVSFALMGLFGCSTRSAGNYTTNQIFADVAATSTDGTNTNVTATFRTSAISLTYLELTPDDSLTGAEGNTSHPLTESSLLGLVTYSALFATATEGTVFTVALNRKKDSGAPMTSMSLPLTFVLASTPSQLSRGEAATFSWSNSSAGTSADPQDLSIKGTCIQDYFTQVDPAATQYTLPAAALRKQSASSSDQCTVNLTVERKRSGTLDSHFMGGTAYGIQARGATFQSTP